MVAVAWGKAAVVAPEREMQRADKDPEHQAPEAKAQVARDRGHKARAAREQPARDRDLKAAE